MRKFWSIALCLLLAGSLAACGAQEKTVSGTESSVSSKTAGSSSAPEASSASGVSSEGQYQVMEIQGFVQKDSGAEEGYEPTIRLLENGNFEFAAYLYDGMVFLHGTYNQEGDDYVLTVTESSSKGVAAENVGEIRLTKTESGFTYSGSQVGVTCEGTVFEKQEG